MNLTIRNLLLAGLLVVTAFHAATALCARERIQEEREARQACEAMFRILN